MLIIGIALRLAHGVILQPLLCFLQARRMRGVADDAFLEIAHPLLHRRHRHLVEVVHPYKIICGEHVLGSLAHYGVALLGRYLQFVIGVQTHEVVYALIDVVLSLPEIEIEDADGVHLLHFLIGVTEIDVLSNGFRHTIEDAFEIEHLRGVLYLHDDDLPLAVAGFYVHTVELVVFLLLVALALEYVDNLHLLTEKHGEKTFQHHKVCLLAQQALYCPVEAHISVSESHMTIII